MHRACLLFLSFIINSPIVNAQNYEERLRRVEAFANAHPSFSIEHEELIEATGVCGNGHVYFVKKNHFAHTEIDWLRQLLSYRFNGTRVDGVNIDFEESTSTKIDEGELLSLASIPRFAKWLGPELKRDVSGLAAARAALTASSNEMPKDWKQFQKHANYTRYVSAADRFFNRLTSRFKIIAVDNLVDCD